jgi:hypothetical protein
MKPRTRTIAILTAAGGLLAGAAFLAPHLGRANRDKPPVVSTPAETPFAKPVAPAPRVQVALLIDTSSSMDGLIDQAKSQLWKVVNELGRGNKGGATPRIEIALFEYGKSTIPAEEGYMRMISELSGDLDKISEDLFALTTNGGEEYAPMAVAKAAKDLAWSTDPDALKFIFIAGNESFQQGPIQVEKAMADAKAAGIVVSTIHCGGAGDDGWKDAAAMANGKFMTIDHNKAVVHIAAPQDDEIAALGGKLNDTYVAYGANGRVYAARQSAQDVNAVSTGKGSVTARSVTKASKSYDNSGWDIVDAQKKGKVQLESLADADLPAEMKGMDGPMRRAYVAAKEAERTKIQDRIKELNAAREKFVLEEQKKSGTSGDDTLDAAMVKVVHELAEKHGFRFE